MRQLYLLLIAFLLFELGMYLLLYKRPSSLVERGIRPKQRSAGHSCDAKHFSVFSSSNTDFKSANGGHIIQANASKVSQAVSAGKLRDNTASVSYDITDKFVHFENVCMCSSTSVHRHIFPFQGRFNVYTNEPTTESKKAPLLVPFYVGYTKPRNNFWIFEFINEAIPSDWQIRNEIVVLPTFWMDMEQLYIFWYNGLPKLYRQLRKITNALFSSTEMNLQKTLVVPRIRKMPLGYRKTILDHGISSINNFSDFLTGSKPTCFRHVIAGEGNTRIRQRDVIDAIRKQADISFNLNRVVCAKYKVVLVKRLGSRHLLNIDELATVIRQQRTGFDVDVVSFEGMTIQQQLEILRCTSLFIAVQGAALAWMIFLPQNAMFIEIWFDGWAPRYKPRADIMRPDLRVKTLECERVTSDVVLRKYAEIWFNHTGSLSEDVKAKVYAKSQKNHAVYGYAYKGSDCVCSNNTILAALPKDKDFKSRFNITLHEK